MCGEGFPNKYALKIHTESQERKEEGIGMYDEKKDVGNDNDEEKDVTEEVMNERAIERLRLRLKAIYRVQEFVFFEPSDGKEIAENRTMKIIFQ